MGLCSAMVRIGKRQVRRLERALGSRSATTTPFTSMTLERDDMELARWWLAHREVWHDPEPVRRFEAAFAAHLQSACAVAFMSGREALSACLDSLELAPGDEVLLPGYTCVVVPNAIRFAGLVPVHADIELDTFGLDAARLEARITPRTRAVVLQHLYGLVSRDTRAVLDLARRRGLRVIEDCAHATGARFDGVPVGNFGELAFFSSEQSKVLSTVQGGVAVTRDPALAERLRDYQGWCALPDDRSIEQLLHRIVLQYHERKEPSLWSEAIAELACRQDLLPPLTAEERRGDRPPGYGRRMPAPVAALARNQLAKLERFCDLRRRTAERWQPFCRQNGYAEPCVVPGSEPVFLRYPVLVEPERKRDLRWAEAQLGVTPGVWFSSCHHPVPVELPDCPVATEAVARCINLPTILP